VRTQNFPQAKEREMTNDELVADITRSNSLTDLAARIKAEHEAVSVALKDSVRLPLRRANC
jgi:hypothetical protein